MHPASKESGIFCAPGTTAAFARVSLRLVLISITARIVPSRPGSCSERTAFLSAQFHERVHGDSKQSASSRGM
jgi:hypothetical protein